MHFEILVEDQSGKNFLDNLLPFIIRVTDTFKVHPYKGIGKLPIGLQSNQDASKRILLEQLPKLLRGYGKTFSSYPENYKAVVILVCDLDTKCLKKFRQELLSLLDKCNPKPETHFCIAIEEMEAWFLGDISAIKKAYPKAKQTILNNYVNDSICNTWELLADAVYPGGSNSLKARGHQSVGYEKSVWGEKITPHMNILNNLSPSFNYFLAKMQEFAGQIDS